MNQFHAFISVCVYLLFSNLIAAQNPTNPYKAPLYWTVYENNFLKEKAGVKDNYISEAEWLANINWVDANLKPYGYNIICIDGWGNVDYNQYGYRTKHSSNWVHDYAWWSAELQKRGMTIGIYDNPLWVNINAANAGIKVKGTNIALSTLINTTENAKWFTWLQVDKPGAEQYVKGYVQHYADMGVKYLRVDFLSWYESGWDRYMGTVGISRPVANYQTALRWMREACDANGIFLSLVMPNLNNDAANEQKYGHMIRINEDCAEGGWSRFSELARGVKRSGWSQYGNAFDGYIYWSKITGRGKMILDGDFIRLNTLSNDEERKSVVSLHLLAGGPLSIADQHNSIGNSLWIYQNEELMTLNADGFVAKPLSNDPTNALSQVWKGQMSNGDWIIGFFNREATSQTRNINIQTEIGLTGNVFVRDLWNHVDVGLVSSLSKSLTSHSCQIYRISSNTNKVISPVFSIKSGTFTSSFSVSLSTSTPGASIYYTVDGSIPTSASTLYSKPIEVGASTLINAIALKSGMSDSYINKEVYTLNLTNSQLAMYVGGTFNSWNLAALPMNYVGNNNWTTSLVSITTGPHQMKFANTNNWTGTDWGNSSGLSGTALVSSGGAPNISFTAPVSTNYSISFNDISLAYSVTNSLTSIYNENISTQKQVTVSCLNHTLMVDIENNESAVIEIINLSGQILRKISTGLKITLVGINSEFINKLAIIRVITKSDNYIFKLIL